MPRKTTMQQILANIEAVASMRPRPDAAENRSARTTSTRAAVASMRPRPDAAENRAGAGNSIRRRRRFNEAAARCRGKPRRVRPNQWSA